MKRILRINFICWTFVVFGISANAQFLNGPTTAYVGEELTYEFYNDISYFDPWWEITGGYVVSETQSGPYFTAVVHWSTGGTNSVAFKDGGSVVMSMNVTVTDWRPPTPNTTFTITNNCGNTQITRNSDPAGEEQWYWQITPWNSSEILGSNATLILTPGAYVGDYYLRAKASFTPPGADPWSENSQSIGFISIYATPNTPTIANHANRKGPGSITISVNPVSGASSYRWYTQLTGGTYDPAQIESSYTFSNLLVTTTLYVAALDGNCESSRLPVTASILPNPIISAVGTDVTTGGSNVSLTTQTFTTYMWKFEDGTSVGTTQTVQVNKPGLYTVQVTDATGTSTSDAFRVKDPLENQNLNFVSTNAVLKSGVKKISDVYGLNFTERNQSVEYMDGSGKKMQTIATQSSISQKDVLVPYRYDNLNRPEASYLSIVTSQTNGQFQSNILGVSSYTNSPHENFYNISSPPINDNIARDLKPYSKTVYEISPLNRVIEQGSEGVHWQPGGASIKSKYSTNPVNEVRYWAINGTTGLPESILPWQANLLKLDISEEWENTVQLGETRSYTSPEGNQVLQRLKKGSGWLDTYYVYDIKGNLLFLLPPALMAELGTNFYPTQEQVDRLAYQYKYDLLGRKIAAKIPATGWRYIVYDKRNRPVLTQDANQANQPSAGEWGFIKYDEFDRPVISGIYQPAVNYTREQLQAIVDALNGGVGYQNTIPPKYLVADIQTGTDIILTAPPVMPEYQATTSVSLKPGFSFSASVTAEFSASIGNGKTQRNSAFPSEGDEALTVTYYDNYNGNSGIFQNPSLQFTTESWQTTVGAEPFVRFSRVIGQATGSSIKILGTDTWLHTVTYYDKSQRTIQGVTQNHLGGVDRSSSLYDFTGKVLEGIGIINGQRIARRNIYDHAGRLLKSYHKLNSQPEIILTAFVYNELGEVIDKKIHSSDNGTNYLQSTDYRYNIKGWLTNINGGTTSSGETDYFTMELAYESIFNSGSTPRKDGFISSTKWKHDIGTKEKLYNLNYNQAEKYLTEAQYKVNKNGAGWTSDIDYYSEKGLDYDENGNIKSLIRNKGVASVIDNLTYSYGITRGNQLKKVVDNAPASFKDEGFKDGTNSDDDYIYDANGNLVLDRNKGITEILYNHFNLPEKVTLNDGSYITNTYDAAGIKLSQKYFTAAHQQVFKTDYLGECVYLNDVLAYIFHEEGRIVPPAYSNIISNREANSTEGYTPNLSVTLSSVYKSGETYVKATSNQAGGTPGVWPIGGNISVKPGEKYSFKVLGYRATAGNAYLKVWGNGVSGNIVWTGAALPQGSANQAWVTSEFTVPNDVTQIKVGVLWNSPVSGDTLYINRVALYKIDWEYQYNLTDHQGSPRVVLSSNPASLTYTATMEVENAVTESGPTGQFLNINYSNIVPHPTANATPGGNEVIKLNRNYRTGPARSLQVYPGDVIDANVQAYYGSGGTFSQSPINTIIASVVGVLSGGSQPIVDGITSAYYSSGSGNPNFLLTPNQGSSKPSAFLNYILFDENYNILEAKSAALGNAGVRHLVSLPIISVKEKGYAFVYISFDDEATSDVYFDDLKITHNESPVTQVNSYYPFGMLAYGWIREGEVENQYKYQGKEYDTLTQWHDFHARQYDASLGRWFAVDPAGQFASPYVGMGNYPLNGVDPDGKWFGVDDLIVAGVGFVYGYVSHGLQTGDWGGKAFANGGINAAMFELGYLTAGGGLSSMGGAGLHAASTGVTVSNAGSFIASSAVNIAASSLLPTIPIYQNKNFSLSISPAFTMKGGGISINGAYTNDGWTIGAGGGFSGGQTSFGGGVSHINKNGIGWGYSSYTYKGATPQRIGELSFIWGGGDGRISLTNDMSMLPLKGSDGGDRFRTGGGQLSYKEFSIGFLMHTGDPGLDKESRKFDYYDGVDGKGGHFTSGTSNDPTLRAGIAYAGYRNYRFGWSSDGIRHVVQNRIMHDGVTSFLKWAHVFKEVSPWFTPMDVGSNPYFDLATNNPFSIWGY
jgi:RHS repeat-associated protein